jgi:hypothetical protein
MLVHLTGCLLGEIVLGRDLDCNNYDYIDYSLEQSLTDEFFSLKVNAG